VSPKLIIEIKITQRWLFLNLVLTSRYEELVVRGLGTKKWTWAIQYKRCDQRHRAQGPVARASEYLALQNSLEDDAGGVGRGNG
jgi:hypothetical protein